MSFRAAGGGQPQFHHSAPIGKKPMRFFRLVAF
jgi:hypothetical protein